MFTKTTPETSDLQDVIDRLILQLENGLSHSDEYAKTTDQLIKLYTLKNATKRPTVSPDTLATIGANLAGILLILNFERAGVVASKALSFVGKLR
jgi:hypothetical protein